MKTNKNIFSGILALLVLCVGRAGYGQTIQVSVAMPVTNQTVTITVPGLGLGGVINVTDAHGVHTQLVANAQGQTQWTPSRYGKHTVSSGPATQTMWVTARPMTFHWWNATLAQTNVTVVMNNDPAWQARGVTTVHWAAGECDYLKSKNPHHGTNSQPQDWTNTWSKKASDGGIAIDELYCEGGSPADAIVQACALTRQAQGPNFSISLWDAGFGTNFYANAAILKSNNITILIEDYYGSWQLHTQRWAAARSYGLQNQTFSGIWPGNKPLTNATAVRADIALVRLASPEANGIAIFAPKTNLLAACDQAIEDYYLKPVLYLSAFSISTNRIQLNVWNLGNDDATGFSLQFQDGSGGVLQTVDLPSLTANGQRLLSVPAGAVAVKVINPAGTANLYTNGLYNIGRPLIEPIPSDIPSPAQRLQIDRKYGLFCHFGLNTYANAEWTDGKVSPEVYAPPADIAAKVDAWVKFAHDAGFRYFLCITKHHDGFCLWNSKCTDYSVGNPKVKVHTDIVKAVADACRKYGIGFAVYYSAWDRHEASYVNPVKYTQYMKAQLTELLTNYGPVCEVWFDGSWDRKAQDWQMAQIYDHIKRLQPDCQVTMNWTIGHPDRPDCTVRPAQQRNGYPIRYFPCDFRIGDPDLPVANDPKHFGHDGKSYYMPYEATVTVSKRDHWFGFAGDEGAKSVAALEEIFWRATAQDNLLVFNIPPDKNGDLIPSQVKAVQELAQRLNLGANKPFPQPAAR